MMNEFELIERFFTRPVRRKLDLGIGDDCALLMPTQDMRLAISTDMLLAGQHFFAHTDPKRLGHKALAVNLSDLAAMGAKPRAFTLCLSLPEIDETWLTQFSSGLLNLADGYDCELIGGDTIRGPLSITITIIGEIRQPFALLRSQAKENDDIWISGELGDAALALRVLQNSVKSPASDLRKLLLRLETPEPRILLGQDLRSIANSAIDISDGLLGDLRHILKASNVGAKIYPHLVPISKILAKQPTALQYECALAGGDDYELCFTANKAQREEIQSIGEKLNLRLTRIGYITNSTELVCLDQSDQIMKIELRGFDHFQ